ncbi:NAC domain containing protein 83 [Actinidia rufa]|uniref:NAC domain containing protein 83 n=1 Tax=Actinidia rufa TaxID=165716 RepID=A0A7J0HDB1_9ERIC|nr:NAC domain containing protein 83 [Actinidia rufa]
MEKKLNFVKNGVLKLPPGFRFHPTDEELVDQYLMRKAYSCLCRPQSYPRSTFANPTPGTCQGTRSRRGTFLVLGKLSIRTGIVRTERPVPGTGRRQE